VNAGSALQVAILLYPGVTALDAVGPWEVFSRIPGAEVRFVGYAGRRWAGLPSVPSDPARFSRRSCN
jgi:putative intracellular protease/amidase